MNASTRVLPAVFSCVLLLGVSGVLADTITSSDLKTLPNNTNVSITLDKFDTSLGTLTGVYLELQVRLKNADVQLDNDDSMTQNGTAQVLNVGNSLTATVTLLKSNFDTFNNGDLVINASQLFVLDPTTGDPVGQFNATGLGDWAQWQPGTLTSGDAGNIHNSVWAGYQAAGGGTFTITANVTYTTGATFSGSNGWFQGNTPDGELYGRVIYSYVVPEPATLAMLAAGALPLAGRWIRRRRVA